MRYDDLSLDQKVEKIIEINTGLAHTWKNVWGWAPNESAKLLSEARLDWLVSLSYTLKLWTVAPTDPHEHDGRLILAWANLGSLVEGALKFFLCVYSGTFGLNFEDQKDEGIFKRLWDHNKATPKDPDGLMLDSLREFYRSTVWLEPERDALDEWLCHIRDRRNTIHAYRDRELGTFEELWLDIAGYLIVLDQLVMRLPDPPDPSAYR